MKDKDYSYWRQKWLKVKDRYSREKGITSFSGYIRYLLALGEKEEERRNQ